MKCTSKKNLITFLFLLMIVASLSSIIPMVQGANPVVVSAELVDPDIGTTGVCAMARYYAYKVVVSDSDGATDLLYVQLQVALQGGGDHSTYRWWEGNDTFISIGDFKNLTTIDAINSNSTKVGNTATVFFLVMSHWNFSDVVGEGLNDLYVFSKDDSSNQGWDTFENIWYSENDLDDYNLDESDNRLNPSDTLYLSGSLTYEGASSVDPPDGNYLINATLGAGVEGTDNTLVSGDFNITVTAESTINPYIYYVEFIYNASGPNAFQTIIVDRIIMNVTANDYFANVDQTVTFTVAGEYDYDGFPCSGLLFDVARNGTYNTSSTPFYDVRSSSGIWNYTVTNANETQYDLTTFTTDLIWVEWGFYYNFYGVYDEDTGLLLDPSERAVNVTAYWIGNDTDTFELNGTISKSYDDRPLYFHFALNNSREYWLSPGDSSFDIYVFEDDTEYYTIEFLDLAGILDTYEYIIARRLVNGTYMTVEKRVVDEENKVVMALGYMERYNIVLGNTIEVVYGDVEFGLSATITLTIKGLDFPRAVTMIYRYVRIYGERAFGNGTGNITITYEDTLSETTSIILYFKYVNGTTAHSYASGSSSLVYVWSNALNNTAYYVEAIYIHDTFGTQIWKQYFPRGYPPNTLSLNWLGSLGFDTSIIIPALIIIFVAVCFSMLNAYLGAFLTVVVAGALAWMGMIQIAPTALVIAFALAIMMGIIAMKRKVRIG